MKKKAMHRSDGGPIAVAEDQTVADLVVRHPQVREHLEQLGIDYCCGGKRPLGQVVAAAGLEWQAFVVALNDTSSANAADSGHTNWNEVPLGVLVDNILEKHHAFTKAQLSRLDGLLTKVEAAHGARHGEMLARLRRLYDGLHDELDAHLMKEEQILFPAIKEIDAFISGRGSKPVIHCGSVANPIRQMEVEHDSAGKALGGMRQVTDDYRLPLDACQTFRALYEGLQALEADLHKHIHLENNILFPKSVRLENSMNKANLLEPDMWDDIPLPTRAQTNAEDEEVPSEPFSPVCYLGIQNMTTRRTPGSSFPKSSLIHSMSSRWSIPRPPRNGGGN